MLVNIASLGSVLLLTVVFGATAQAGGRPDSTSRDWFGHIEGGWAFGNGDTADFVDDDWTFSGGAIYWPSDWPVGISFDASYTRFDLSGTALRSINDAIVQDPNNNGEITGGDVETWQLAINGIWSLGPDTVNGFYVTGGVSYNRVRGAVAETGLVYYPPICDPWYWWWCFPGGIGQGQFVSDQRSENEFGWNVGVGYSFTTTGGQLFVEARYQHIDVGDKSLEFVPLTFGYRW
jgi:hypothetical protein